MSTATADLLPSTRPAAGLAVLTPEQLAAPIMPFSSIGAFESAQRIAKCLATSDLVPVQYRGADKMGNILVAMDMATRMDAGIMPVLQNLNVIHGRPSWAATFISAAIIKSRRFGPLRYIFEEDAPRIGTALPKHIKNRSCKVVTRDRETGDEIIGPDVSMEMAYAEGWATKPGSKWLTMPGMMLQYRATSFFGKLYAPDILMGMRDEYEAQDMVDIAPATPAKVALAGFIEAAPGAPADAPKLTPAAEAAPKPVKPTRTAKPKPGEEPAAGEAAPAGAPEASGETPESEDYKLCASENRYIEKELGDLEPFFNGYLVDNHELAAGAEWQFLPLLTLRKISANLSRIKPALKTIAEAAAKSAGDNQSAGA